MEYKGWQIECVFNYTNGKTDWQIYKEEAAHMLPSMTLEEVKKTIDEYEKD